MSGSICALEKVPRAPGLRGSCAGMSYTGTGEVSGQGAESAGAFGRAAPSSSLPGLLITLPPL